MKALVLGSTGAVGKALVKELVENSAFTHVRAITRRQFTFSLPPASTSTTSKPIFDTKIVDFSNLDAHKSELQGFEYIFITMGTTRAAAGSTADFIAQDQELTVRAASYTITPSLTQHILYCTSPYLVSHHTSLSLLSISLDREREAL